MAIGVHLMVCVGGSDRIEWLAVRDVYVSMMGKKECNRMVLPAGFIIGTCVNLFILLTGRVVWAVVRVRGSGSRCYAFLSCFCFIDLANLLDSEISGKEDTTRSFEKHAHSVLNRKPTADRLLASCLVYFI